MDVEFCYIVSGEFVINFSLVYSYGKCDGEGKKLLQWVDVVLWGKCVEQFVQYLVKCIEVWCVIEDLYFEIFICCGESIECMKLFGWIQFIEFVGYCCISSEVELQCEVV